MARSPIIRVALVVLLLIAVPVTTVMWSDLLARVRREVDMEGVGGFLGKCAIALIVGLLHWLATREREAAEDLIQKVKKSTPAERPGPTKAAAAAAATEVRPKSE
mmetsp:Transcript_71784/g.162908  ORF Transcript_71784/g.162908 Transcript_71784/m.162908 type:complete len:105 (+) Transcript_71784:82-396(+)